MTTPTPTPEVEPVCICGHAESQHFEDCCITEITGCTCGDFLTGEAAREQIDRLVRIVREQRVAPTPDDAGLRQRIALAFGAHRNGLASDGQGWFRSDADRVECCALADVMLPLVAADRAAALREVLAAIEDPTRRERAAVHFNMGSGLGWESARDVVRLMIDPRCSRARAGAVHQDGQP